MTAAQSLRWTTIGSVLLALLACAGAPSEAPVELSPADRELIEVQRQWLRKPMTSCEDGVEGRWVGQDLRETYWIRYILDIDRVSPLSDHLTGTITSVVWDRALPSVPPRCAAGEGKYNTHQPASGQIDGTHVVFIGHSVTIEDTCGLHTNTYSADRINGYLLESESEMHTINDDLVNEANAVLFVRTECNQTEAGVLLRWLRKLAEELSGG